MSCWTVCSVLARCHCVYLFFLVHLFLSISFSQLAPDVLAQSPHRLSVMLIGGLQNLLFWIIGKVAGLLYYWLYSCLRICHNRIW